MANNDKGFGSMDRDRQREIAGMGGRKAHEVGTAHEWDTQEARAAGRKGGLASAAAKKARKLAAVSGTASTSAPASAAV